MSGITAAINTALSGLTAFEAGINTVSNNLANQATPGYAVESVSTGTLAGPAGQPGVGVSAPVVTRAANGFAASLLRTANAASQAASTQSAQLTTISNALQNNGNVQSALNQFFLDFGTLAANPSSAALGQTVLGDAQNVTGSFQSAASTLNGALTGAQQTVTQGVASANVLLTQLAGINQSLIGAPNDVNLLDQQQAALTSLSQLLPVSTITQPSGGVIVTSGGSILLDQSGVQTLSATTGTSTTAPVVTAGSNNAPVSLGAADGSIGGALNAYDQGVSALNGLNTLAAVFAGAVNTAQAQGLTASGVPGGNLFSVPRPSVTASSKNTGGSVVSALISNSSLLPTDGGPFLLTYSHGGSWTAIDQSSGQAYTGSGSSPSFAGLTLTVLGSPANGDQFTLNPAPKAATGISVSATGPSAIASADPYVLNPGTLQSSGAVTDSNAGTLTAGADTVAGASPYAAVVPASYYGQNLQITFNTASTYTVSTSAAPGTAIATGALTSAGKGYVAVAFPTSGQASGSYWQLPFSGAPAAGDTYTLTPGGATSGSNANRIAALWSGSANTTSGSLQNAFVSLSTNLGNNASQAQQLATTTASAVTTATSTLQTISGVNTDQQAVILTQYSQAYQAAAQAISTAHSMFESLLQAV
jgi:flagellar hook-associated protein 1 FlgK